MADRKSSARKVLSGSPAGASNGQIGNQLRPDDALVREFVWDVISINVHLEEIRSIWARNLGITSPQWLILMAVNDLDRGNGASVRAVSTKLHVDPSFVTTQTKSLEKNGFVRRIPSEEDGRVVLMSLTDKASKQIASLYAQQATTESFIFSDFDDIELRSITDKLTLLKERMGKALLKIAAES
jgi:MarR family transcriptional regulator, organic hydroperoxide resistance regulator